MIDDQTRQRNLLVDRKRLALLSMLIAAPRRDDGALRTLMALRSVSSRMSAEDDGTDFSCGVDELDAALRRDVLRPPSDDGFGSYVARSDGRIAGFFHLRRSHILCVHPDGQTRDAAVAPIPLVMLPRIAVDRRHQGTGLGAALLADALRLGLEAGQTIGAEALYIHALSDEVRPFYSRFGLRPTAPVIDPRGFIATVADLAMARSRPKTA
ncbi:MAG: GNAT family N-acetyltransferase [Proteobacteria bacterium]|nr:GNAT family N-acetyltransferase [Pseudomonadota bacterium]